MLFPPKKFSLPAAITQNTTVALICFFLSAALCFDGGRVLDALVHAMEWALLASSVSYLLILLLISRRNFASPSDQLFARFGLIAMVAISYFILGAFV